MSPPYAVVTFIDDVPDNPNDEITSEVPSSWVTTDEKHCWWPSSMKNITILITKQVQPDPSDNRWQLCNIKLDAYFDNLEAARKKAQTLSSSSDESDLRNRSRRQRKKRKANSPQVVEENSESSQDLPVEKRGAVLPPPPNCEVEFEHDDIIMSMSDIPISFEDPVIESHLRAISSDLTPTKSRSDTAGTSGVVRLFDAFLPSTTDLADARMKYLTPPSRKFTNQKRLFDSSARSSANETAPIITFPSSQSHADMNGQLRYNSPVPSTSSMSAVEFNRNSSILETPKRPCQRHRGSIEDTPETSMPSMQEPAVTSLREFIRENNEKVLKGLAGVIVQMTKINERLHKLENQISVPLSSIQNTNHTPELNILPFCTTDQIEALEADLLDQEGHPHSKSDLMNLLLRVGGNGMKDNTIRILKTVFSNKVAVKSSWLGLRQNFQISKLNITKMIKDAVAVKHPHTDKEFEELASEWFRQANQRFKRENKDKEN